MRDMIHRDSRDLSQFLEFLRKNCQLATLVVSLSILSGLGNAPAQDEDEVVPSRIEFSQLDTFLKNKDGSLIQYFNITFEEFERVYNALNSRTPAEVSAAYSIRTASIVAKVRAQTAEMDVELNILTRSNSGIEVPIEMDDAFFPLAENDLVRRNKKFYVRINGKKNETVSIKLKAIQRVTSVKDFKQLRMQLPSATFTTVQVHELDAGQIFSSDQDSISRQIEPLFDGGSAIEFSGLKDNAKISWSKRTRNTIALQGQVGQDLKVTSIVEPDRIRYEAVFSLQASEPLSGFRIGLPKQTTEASLDASSEMLLTREPEDELWKSYKIDFGRQGTSFEDIKLEWTVSRTEGKLSLVGFEIYGFEMSGGKLVVRSDGDVSFVLANRFNLEEEESVQLNRQYNYSFQTTVFSANVYTIEETIKNQRRIDVVIKLLPESVFIDFQLPLDLVPENPDSVIVKLNGWDLIPGQKGLAIDSLLRQVKVSPVFFLNEGQSRSIQFSLDGRILGDRELKFPVLENIGPGGYRYMVTCGPELIATFARDQNPKLEFVSQLESETITSGKSLTVSADGGVPPGLKLRIEPVLPVIEGKREIRVFESRGEFFLQSTCTIKSSREFDSIAMEFHMSLQSLQLNGIDVDFDSMQKDKAFLLKLEKPESKAVLTSTINLGEWNDPSSIPVKLTDFLLPLKSGFGESEQSYVEIQGRNYSAVPVKSDLQVITSSGLQVIPDDAWTPTSSIDNEPEAKYSGHSSGRIELSKTKLTDEDVQVDQVWCQTHVNNEFRQDRIVIRFTPMSSRVEWAIPKEARLISCLLNGQNVNFEKLSDETRVKTYFNRLFNQQVIEFELRTFHSSFQNQLGIHLPSTERILWCDKMFWSVHLPDSHYVLKYSNGLSSAYALDWNGFFLRPIPKLSARDLERWIKVEKKGLMGTQGNDYLFSSFGIVDGRSLIIISKPRFVLIFGLMFVSLGCAFATLSFMRHTLLLVTIASAILILGMWYPIWFVQLLQIEVFVLFLFGVGFIVSRITNWLNPVKDETRIETNVPSLILASPESGIEPSGETRGLADGGSEKSQ